MLDGMVTYTNRFARGTHMKSSIHNYQFRLQILTLERAFQAHDSFQDLSTYSDNIWKLNSGIFAFLWDQIISVLLDVCWFCVCVRARTRACVCHIILNSKAKANICRHVYDMDGMISSRCEHEKKYSSFVNIDHTYQCWMTSLWA